MTSTPWTLADAVALCTAIEKFAPIFGAHVALTGGVLYAEGPRKDLDLLFYRIRQHAQINVDGLFDALKLIGVERVTKNAQWCIKATTANGARKIDCFFPELPLGDGIGSDGKEVK